ncbi:MAG: hypothetical protein J6K96_05785 [Treponema sp.]|nr:hypothetical protein [Treponema sp.]
MKNKSAATKSAAILIAFGILFAAAGIARGDTAVLLRKAVFICMECIGIG